MASKGRGETRPKAVKPGAGKVGPREALKLLHRFIREHPLYAEKPDKKYVRELVELSKKADPNETGKAIVQMKRDVAARKTTPADRKQRIARFLDTLTDESVRKIGKFQIDWVVATAKACIRAPGEWYRLNHV